MNPSLSRRDSERGFTIVEMLVSVAVFVMILTFVAQMVNSTAISTGLSNKRSDADGQARLIFDRMASDFAGMPKRKDVDFIFSKQVGNDKMFFYSEAPAYSATNATWYPAPGQPDPKSSVALIGYSVNTGNDNTNSGITPPPYCLQRLGKGLTWDANNGFGGIAFLTFPSNIISPYSPLSQTTLAGNSYTSTAIGTAPVYNGTDPDFDVLANQVFRMEFCFQVKDLRVAGQVGTAYSNYPIAVNGNNPLSNIHTSDPDPTSSATTGDRWYNKSDNRAFVCTNGTSSASTWVSNGMADVTAIVVAIAVLDSNSRKIVTSTELASAVTNLTDFPDQTPTADVDLMATTWQKALYKTSPTFAAITGLPVQDAGQIRIYQRYFYLNNN